MYYLHFRNIKEVDKKLLKNTHLPRCAANRTAQRMIHIRLAIRFLRALHLNIFEQFRELDFLKNANN